LWRLKGRLGVTSESLGAMARAYGPATAQIGSTSYGAEYARLQRLLASTVGGMVV
jgi:hypothetical protein